jgi:RNA polymerase sigma-70 factor (ECF subfamily)
MLDASFAGGLIGVWPVSVSQASPFDEAAAGELERRVERALAGLPSRHREVLLLVTVEGFTPAEAAAVCGVSAEALRQRLSRARAALARELSATGGYRARVLSEVTT